MLTLTKTGARRHTWGNSSNATDPTHRGWGSVFTRIVFSVLAVLPASWALCNDNYLNRPQEVGTTEQIPLNDTGPATLYVSDEQRNALPTYPQQSSYNTYESFPASMEPSMADELGEFIAPGRTVYLPSLPCIQGVFAQVDYFNWHESDHIESIDESGPMITLGYQARKPDKRYRLAMFFGNVNFDGDFPSEEGFAVVPSDTDYIGATLEYDFRWRLPRRPTDGIFVGLGVRYWSRTANSSITTPYPDINVTYTLKQDWWTVYPRAGFDINRRLRNGWHLYMSGSLGLTAYTSEGCKADMDMAVTGNPVNVNVDLFDVTVNPKCSMYARAELTLRKNRTFLSLIVERFGWEESNHVGDDDLYQSRASMLTAGMLAGFTF